MIPKRGYFQPLDITGQIGWLWWFILFMAGIILWSETTFKLEMVPIIYLLLMLALGITIIFGTRLCLRLRKNFSYNDG